MELPSSQRSTTVLTMPFGYKNRGNSNLASINSQKDLLQPSDTHPDTEIILTPNNMRYEFDHIFNHKTTQEQVYEKVAEPVLQEVLKG